MPAPSTPRPNTRLPIAVPRNGVSAWPCRRPSASDAFGLPRPIVAAQAISTAAMTSWVTTAPTAVSQRAAVIVLRPQPLIGDRGLLVEDHPRHDHGADIGRRQIEIVLVGIGNVEADPASNACRVRMRRPGDEEERQLEQPDGDRRPLDPAIRAGEHHGQQRDRGDRQRGDARQAVQLAHAGDAGEFGQQRADRGDAQAGRRTPSPRTGRTCRGSTRHGRGR